MNITKLLRPISSRFRYSPTSRFITTDSTSFSIPVVDLAYDIYTPTAGCTAKDNLSPLIFVHGLFGNKSNSRAVSRILANDLTREVYCVDLRNHGHSPHSPRHDFPAMAHDLENFIQTNLSGGNKKAILVGHSMGAKAAMAVSLRRPDLVQGLVSVDNAPVGHGVGKQFMGYLRTMAEIERKRVSSKKAAYEIFERVEPNRGITSFVMTNLIKEESEGAPPQFKFRVPVDIMMKEIDRVGEWPFEINGDLKYNGPTLFIGGTKSNYINPKCEPAMKSFFPNYQLDMVEAGHWVISENMTDFITVLKRFIRKENI